MIVIKAKTSKRLEHTQRDTATYNEYPERAKQWNGANI